VQRGWGRVAKGAVGRISATRRPHLSHPPAASCAPRPHPVWRPVSSRRARSELRLSSGRERAPLGARPARARLAVRCGGVRYGAVACGGVRYGAVRCGGVRYGAVACGTVRWRAVRCGTVRYAAVAYGGVRWRAVACGGVLWRAVACGGVRWRAVVSYLILSRAVASVRAFDIREVAPTPSLPPARRPPEERQDDAHHARGRTGATGGHGTADER
jgi:hypothetical protein